MNLRSRHRLSLTAISMIVCPLLVSLVALSQDALDAMAVEPISDSGLVAQTKPESKAESERLLELGNQQIDKNQFREAVKTLESGAFSSE